MAYHQLEPWGPLRQALYAAMMVIAALAPWRKKPLKPADVFPELGDGQRGLPTAEGLAAKLRGWAAEGKGKTGRAGMSDLAREAAQTMGR